MTASVTPIKQRRLPAAKSGGTRGAAIGDRKPTAVQVPARLLRPRGDRGALAPTRTSASPPQYLLRSTVRFHWEGRAYVGTIVGVAHDDPVRYDIRRDEKPRSTRRPIQRIVFGVPHCAIERCFAPPRPEDKVTVIDDLLLKAPPAAALRPRPERRDFLAQLLRFGRGQ